jgi:hypothetical protein
VSAAAALCLLAAPAQAALVVDFNDQSVLNRVVLPRSSEMNVVVRLSGGSPQVLRFYDRIIAIVATDIDHDGGVDLTALSERHGLFIWMSKGGTGHLKALKRKHHQHGFSLITRGPLASAPQSSSESSPAPGGQDERDRPAQDERSTDELHEQPLLERLSDAVPALPTDRGDASPSRAPPPAS